MSFSINFFRVSQDELDTLIQTQDQALFDKLADERVGNPPFGATTNEFTPECIDLLENLPFAKPLLQHIQSKPHDVLAPLAGYGDTRVMTPDEAYTMWNSFTDDCCIESEIYRYCKKNNKDYDYEYEAPLFTFYDLQDMFYHAKDNNFFIISYCE